MKRTADRCDMPEIDSQHHTFTENRTEQNGLFQLEHIRFNVSIQIHIHEYGHVKENKKKKK